MYFGQIHPYPSSSFHTTPHYNSLLISFGPVLESRSSPSVARMCMHKQPPTAAWVTSTLEMSDTPSSRSHQLPRAPSVPGGA